VTGETRRINRGAGHSYILDGLAVDGVTGILDRGVAKPALINWSAEQTAAYAVNNWDELSQDGLVQRLKKIEKGRFESFKAATARGTKVHQYAAALVVGETVDVPDPYRDYVDQCIRFLDEWNVHELAVEVTVINRQWRYMGAADLIARVGDSLECWLFDWKTGGGGIFPEVALQLAAYANAETMLDPDDNELELPRITRAAAVSLRADYYEVIPVDITPATFRTFLYAQQMAQFSQRDRADFVGEALKNPTVEGVA
jgi:hypothetical protein